MNLLKGDGIVSQRDSRLRSYIDVVINDAYKTEGRPNDCRWEFKVIDTEVLFVMKSGYMKPMRRAVYRLVNNLPKNFGLNFELLLPYSRDCLGAGKSENMHYDLFDLDSGIDPHHSIDTWLVFGKWYTIRSFYGLVKNDVAGIPHLTAMKEHGYDYTSDYKRGDKDRLEQWATFKRTFTEIYGMSPWDAHLKMCKYYYAINHVDEWKAEYDKNITMNRCGYWSVCSDHSCGCSPDAPVSQGFSMETYASMLESFKKDTMEY